MKRLTLVRHAKSSWGDPGLRDFERPLNKRGKHDAPMVGERLAGIGHRPDLIISSPAKRALTTAKMIAKALGIAKQEISRNEVIYEAYVDELMTLIQQLDDGFQHAMLVGHNPGFTDLANLLSSVRLDNMPTCAVFCVDFDITSWQLVTPGSGKFIFFDFPKNPSPIQIK